MTSQCCAEPVQPQNTIQNPLLHVTGCRFQAPTSTRPIPNSVNSAHLPRTPRPLSTLSTCHIISFCSPEPFFRFYTCHLTPPSVFCELQDANMMTNTQSPSPSLYHTLHNFSSSVKFTLLSYIFHSPMRAALPFSCDCWICWILHGRSRAKDINYSSWQI